MVIRSYIIVVGCVITVVELKIKSFSDRGTYSSIMGAVIQCQGSALKILHLKKKHGSRWNKANKMLMIVEVGWWVYGGSVYDSTSALCLKISIIKDKNQNRSFLWMTNFLESRSYNTFISSLQFIFKINIYVSILLPWLVHEAVEHVYLTHDHSHLLSTFHGPEPCLVVITMQYGLMFATVFWCRLDY